MWIRFDPRFHQYVDFDYLYTASYVLMGVGAVMVVICFLGCCGAYKESNCMLGTFFTFLLIIFMTVVVVMVLGYFRKDDVEELVSVTVGRAIMDYHDENKPWGSVLMDAVQINFACCGGERASLDYLSNLKLIPDTCRLVNYGNPCTSALFDFIVANFMIVVGVAIGVGVTVILGLILACCLIYAIKKDMYDPYMYDVSKYKM